MDQEIIRVVKLAYRQLLADLYLDGIENKEDARKIMKGFDIKVACDLVIKAWRKVIAHL